MNKPNFFIVGAPKCGTTALSEYLRDHPNILISRPKEPHYFAEDFPKYRARNSLDDYLQLFRGGTSQHLATGEASVFYLYSSVALKNIYQFNKNAKIIVMLRNPVDLVYSFYSQLYYTFDEDEKDFETAWKLQSVRKRGIRIPRNCREPAFLQYAQIGRLGDQIERLVDVFPKAQVKIILFDDFKTSTQAVYEDVLLFLGVPSDGRSRFPRINENKSYRLRWLNQLFVRPPLPIFHSGRKVKKLIGLERISVLAKITKLNKKLFTEKRDRIPLTSYFRAELTSVFEKDIEKLSCILKEDLNHWVQKTSRM